MITHVQLKQKQLDQLFDWVDSLPLSRPKKNINRDFSDAAMMAQTIDNYYPKLVQLHNYPAGNSYKMKLTNWKTLNNKVLRKINMPITEQDCSRLANATPMAIEAVLYEFKKSIDDRKLLYRQQNEQDIDQQEYMNDQDIYSEQGGAALGIGVGENNKQGQIQNTSSKQRMSFGANKKQNSITRAQELRQILSLIKEKVKIVEKSLERKDGQIRQLEEILQEAEK